MLAHGIGAEEVVRTVLDATRTCVADNPEAAKWIWTPADARKNNGSRQVRAECEEQRIWRLCLDFIAKHPDRLADRLPSQMQETLLEALAENRRPRVCHSSHIGWHIRSWGEKTSSNKASSGGTGGQNKSGKASSGRRVLELRPFQPFDVNDAAAALVAVR